MAGYIKLNKEDLMVNLNDVPHFSTTEDILPFNKIIGQKRAVQSIELGIEMDRKEYNIYISGRSSTGKTSYIVNKIKEYGKEMSTPDDWCYVYNFENSKEPMALHFKSHTIYEFKHDMDKFIEELFKRVPAMYNDKSYEMEKNSIISKFEKLISENSTRLYDIAKEMNFVIDKKSEEDYLFIPLIDGKEMNKEIYEQLSDKDKKTLEEDLDKIRLTAFEVNKEINILNKQMTDEIFELDNEIAENIIEDKIDSLKNKYGLDEQIIRYFDLVKEDIIDNISGFIEYDNYEAEKKELIKEEFLKRYKVNVIINNDNVKGLPVIYEDSPEYSNLFGKIEYENRRGGLVTDFTMIRPGSIHKANGGYLIMNAEKLLNSPNSWKALKRCLKSESIILENPKSNIEFTPILSLKPQNIPLNIKVILVGSDLTYSLLSMNDPDFNKLFKIKVEFDSKIDNEEENIKNIIGFISNYVVENNTLNVTREGIIQLLRYSCRLAGNKKYFSARMSMLLQILDVANILAKKTNEKSIDAVHIKNSINEIENMHGLLKTKVLNMYKNNKYIVNLNGTKVGQINGLSVIDYGDSIVGQQHRITVTTFAGKKGVINIERETDMSGKIHSKGIMILSGYIGELLGQDTSLSFNASIVFEQLYSGIEGDSASAAELIALLSSLSDIPIKQSLAITGSVNQKGEIQPIGGVNEKIEGYFDICNIYGLDGSHGVIIPDTNVDDLVLDDRVIEAVENGKFNIYSVKNIEQCMEILFETEFKDEENLLDKIKNRIVVKMEKYNSVLKSKIYIHEANYTE